MECRSGAFDGTPFHCVPDYKRRRHRNYVSLAVFAVFLLLTPAAAQFDLGEDTLEGDPSELMDLSPDEMRAALTKAALVPKPESGPFLLEGLAALREPKKDEGIGLSPSSLQRKEQLAVFETVVKALITIADEKLLGEMKAMSASKDREVAQAAIRLMGLAGKAEAVGTLQELARSNDPGKRTVALLALGDTETKSALPFLDRDWPGPERLAARHAAERLRWQLGLWEPKPRGQKTGRLLFSGLGKAPNTKGWRIQVKALDKEAGASDFATANLVLVDAGTGAEAKWWQSVEMVETLGKFLSGGGTLVCLGSDLLRNTGLVAALAKLNVQVPQQWEAKGGTCRASYGDFHLILTAPYCIDEVRESVSAPGGWKKWSSDQRAAFRDRLDDRKSPFIFQCVGEGVVVFSAIDLLDNSFLRENLYAAAFGSECRNPKGFVWDLSHDWVSEHREWAKPPAGAKPRVLFLMPRLFKRGIVEIAQRMDLTYSFVPLLTTKTKGAKTGRETQMEYTLSAETIEGLQSVLGMPWDLMVVGNMSIQGTGYYQTFGWRDVPLRLRRFVRDKVRAGAGLAFLSAAGDPFLGENRRPGVTPSWPIAVGGKTASLDRHFPFSPPALSFRQLGKGRLVFLNSGLPFMALWDPPEREQPKGFVVPGVETTRVVFPTEEYRYAALVKSLLWAAGQDFAPQIAKAAPSATDLPAGEPFTIEALLSDAPAEGAAVEATIRDRFDRQTHRATAEARGRKCAIALPTMAEGAYVVDCVLRNAKGEALDWAACAVRIRGESKILAVQTDRDSYEPGDTAKVTVKVANADGLKLAHRLVDTYGRLVHLGTAPAGESVEVAVPLAKPRSRLHYLWLELLTEDGKSLSVHRQPLVVRLAEPDDYRWYQAGGSSSNFARQLAAAGVDRMNLPAEPSDIVDVALERNMGFWSAWSHIGSGYAGRANAEGTGHSVCPSGPGFRYELRQNFEATLPRAKRHGVELFMLQDESSAGIGRCNAPPCVFAFQNYLRGMYGTVESLNESWGQDCKRWDEVKRVSSQDPARLAPQVDHTMFMRRLYAEWIDQSQGGIRRFIPDARVGFSVSWGDAWELSRYLSMTIWHRRALFYDYHLSYGRPEVIYGSWYGPTYNKSDRNEADAHHDVWAALLNGANAFFEWWGARHMGYNFVRPDLSLFEIPRIMSEEVAEIKAGVGKMLIEAEYVTLPIVLYQSSRSSVAVSTLEERSSDPEAQKPSSASSVRGILRRAQVPVRYVHSEQVEDGVLAKGDIRLVYMSREIALSDCELEALEGFVENGGILVADYDIGLRDEHGNVRPTSPLANVFGIKSDSAVDLGDTAELRVDEDFEQIRFSGLKGVLARKGFGAKVAVTTGTALASIGGKVPALIVNRHGKGLAIYLNFHPGLIPGERGATFLRDLCEALVDQAGVERPFAVVDRDGRGPEVKLRMGTFRNGEQMYVGFLVDPEGNALAEQEKMEVTLKYAREGYLYDVRRRKSLGKRKELALTVTPGIAELYSLLPYSVEGVEVSLAGAAIAPGEVAHVQAKVRISGEKTGDHVLAIRVTDATGRHRKEHDRNLVAKGGAGAAEVPIALNDPSGEWKLEFRDVASGVVATATFRVLK